MAPYIRKFSAMKNSFQIPPIAIFSLLSAIILGFGCAKSAGTQAPAPFSNPPADTTALATRKTYLALGDSYTIGQSVDASERFPAQTIRLLKSYNLTFKDPDYIAVTGWTTINLMSAINAQKPANNYDIVTLLIGVNDQYQHLDTAGYRTRFAQLLSKAIELANNNKAHVFVLSIPDYSATPFVDPLAKQRVSMEIDQFNAINKQITVQNGVAYVDITPSTRQAANDPALVAPDGLHPSGKEYSKWADMLASFVKKALQ